MKLFIDDKVNDPVHNIYVVKQKYHASNKYKDFSSYYLEDFDKNKPSHVISLKTGEYFKSSGGIFTAPEAFAKLLNDKNVTIVVNGKNQGSLHGRVEVMSDEMASAINLHAMVLFDQMALERADRKRSEEKEDHKEPVLRQVSYTPKGDRETAKAVEKPLKLLGNDEMNKMAIKTVLIAKIVDRGMLDKKEAKKSEKRDEAAIETRKQAASDNIEKNSESAQVREAQANEQRVDKDGNTVLVDNRHIVQSRIQ